MRWKLGGGRGGTRDGDVRAYYGAQEYKLQLKSITYLQLKTVT
jgi:hypothetical protein